MGDAAELDAWDRAERRTPRCLWKVKPEGLEGLLVYPESSSVSILTRVVSTSFCPPSSTPHPCDDKGSFMSNSYSLS